MSKQSNFYDPFRKKWVAATLEEGVRQKLLQHMVEKLGYPKELLVVEKKISEIPHLKHLAKQLPNRRIDLLCFFKKEDTFYPLLLIECKEASLSDRAFNQLMSYNDYIKAPYIALASTKGVRFEILSLQKNTQSRYLSFLPSFAELVKNVEYV